RTPLSSLFPYTTLFRSQIAGNLLIAQRLGINIIQNALADLAVIDDIGKLNFIGVDAGAAVFFFYTPLAGITFVCSGKVGLAARSKRVDGIRHAQTLHRDRAQLGFVVCVGSASTNWQVSRAVRGYDRFNRG